MNHPIPAAPEGLVVRGPAIVRLVLVVLGPSAVEELAAALVALGFDPQGLAISLPEDWPIDRPADWPGEPVAAGDIAVNESLIRVSGRFLGPPRLFRRDMPLGDLATFTLLGAWHYGPPLTDRRTAAGAAPPMGPYGALQPRPPAAPPPPKDHRGAVALVTGASLLGLGIWSSMRAHKRIEKETLRLAVAAEQQHREEIDRRAREMVREGRPLDEVEIMLEDAEFARPLEPLPDVG